MHMQIQRLCALVASWLRKQTYASMRITDNRKKVSLGFPTIHNVICI